MIPNKINLFGFSLTRSVFLLLLVIVFGVFFLVIKTIGGIWRKIQKSLGILPDDENLEVDTTLVSQQEVQKSLAKNAGVQTQMTTQNKMKANDIFSAIDGFGIDMDKLESIMNSITGPNQMAAVSNFYGIRTVSVGWVLRHTGDLKSTLYWRLTSWQYKRIKPRLDLLNLIK